MGFRVLLILQHLFREILVEAVLGVHVGSVKIKKYMCWYAHRELFVRNESMVERMVGSTSSASNVHGVVNDNSNPYMNIE